MIPCPKPTSVDFESFAIEGRPVYPPIPVGVSIKYWGQKSQYYAFGHRTENNCTWGAAQRALFQAYTTPDGVLCQNGKFDIDVGEVHMGLPRLHWTKYHDTMFLLFLDDPHQKDIGLKPSAERLLGMKPEEQNRVAEWLIANQPIPGVRITPGKDGDHYAGKYIAFAPGDIVGKYANGDVDRTERLFKLLWQKTRDRDMLEAYDTERELMLYLLDEFERPGVRVDLTRLRTDTRRYQRAQLEVDQWIIKLLKAPADINLNSGQQLVEAMLKAGVADKRLLGITKTGKVSTNKEALLNGVTNKDLLTVLKYRSQLKTCVSTFMLPWLQVAEKTSGVIYFNWNQVKSPSGDDTVGTRTGRLSSNPNAQNMPKLFDEVEFPRGLDVPQLPLLRSYIIPWADGHVLLGRDYSQQELRILGHFEGGVLMDAYTENPWLDVHEHARVLINKMTGKNFERKPIKNTGFGLLYGMGIGKLAIKSNITVDVAKEVKQAYLAIFPGLKAMYTDMAVRARAKRPIRTWGGREYFCEEPKFIDGRWHTYDYKMLNVLIQGSAADCTKQAMLNFCRVRPAGVRIYLTVHDEFLISCPKNVAKQTMELLRKAMEAVVFDVAMLSEGKWSGKNWAEMKTYDKTGRIECRL